MREDSLTLYGFAADDERDMFEQVQTVSGVGPRLALAMLVGARPRPPARARSPAATSRPSPRCPGIGRKGAERIVLELRDKIGLPSGAAAGRRPPAPAGPGAAWRDQVAEALVGLGWSAKQAEDAVVARRRAAPADGDRPCRRCSGRALRELGR